MITGLVALILVLLFIVLEGRTRHGKDAASLDRGAEDRGSTTLIGLGFGISFVLLFVSVVLGYFGLAVLPRAALIGALGLVIEVSGMGLRLWANQVLGKFYTRTLRTTSEQTIVRDGPYKLIRHPGYLGMLIMWCGAALATVNWVALVGVPVLMLIVYVYRIGAEETMMAASMGSAYQTYQKESWRLVPHVF